MEDQFNPLVSSPEHQMRRRHFLTYFSSLGLASTLLPGVLWAQMKEKKTSKVTTQMIASAEELAGLKFTSEERELMADGVNRNLESVEKLRGISLPNSTPPALYFNPLPPQAAHNFKRPPLKLKKKRAEAVPANLEDVAFWPVTRLSALLRSGKVRSIDLTRMYLKRLKRYDPKLKCVITLTEDLALQQAEKADREMAGGHYRGPLHGIPWGAKDLLAAKGYPTTWGAMPYKDQVIDEDATVIKRLAEAGAVLVAKLTLGALAWGDVWFGGKTRNPWNPEQGSSGSSAGPASATSAGLVGFSIGTETLGSIVSPSTRCGATGLRPSFGRISRSGAMTLSWSMDKIGPICRSVEDCALVFHAIYGPDGSDLSVVDRPFNWKSGMDFRSLRVGYLKSAFEGKRRDEEWKANDLATLERLRGLGVKLIPLELPDFPVGDMTFILNVEGAAAFDELTRSNRDDLMVRQGKRAWPNVFRQAQLVSAVEYLQANRIRTRLIEATVQALSRVDVYVSPSYGGSNLALTNLTGNPTVVLPNGFRKDGTPTSITFNGRLFAEAEVLALAAAYQQATDFHLKHPHLEG